MSRRERHFQDTEEMQQDKIRKRKKENEFKKSPRRKTLESGKVLSFQKLHLQMHLGFQIIPNGFEIEILTPVFCK